MNFESVRVSPNRTPHEDVDPLREKISRSNPAVDRRAGAIGHGAEPQTTGGILVATGVSHPSWIGGSLPFGTTCTLEKIKHHHQSISTKKCQKKREILSWDKKLQVFKHGFCWCSCFISEFLAPRIPREFFSQQKSAGDSQDRPK